MRYSTFLFFILSLKSVYFKLIELLNMDAKFHQKYLTLVLSQGYDQAISQWYNCLQA